MGDRFIAAAVLATTPLLPILALQGRYVRKHTPRLPGAAGPASGTAPADGDPITLVVVGESTVAGVGAPDHEHALSGQVAAALAARTRRAVRWRAIGQIGATAHSARAELAPQLARAPADLIVLALGVNDVLQLHRPARWRRDLELLIAALRERAGPAPVLIAAVPPLGEFPALPQPLRGVLGLRAAMLDRAARKLASALDRVIYSAARLDQPAGFFCSDGFHPSTQGYARWGALLAPELVRLVET